MRKPYPIVVRCAVDKIYGFCIARKGIGKNKTYEYYFYNDRDLVNEEIRENYYCIIGGAIAVILYDWRKSARTLNNSTTNSSRLHNMRVHFTVEYHRPSPLERKIELIGGGNN